MMAHQLTPLFIPSANGNLFALHFSPGDGVAKKCIVHIPAFAEEMNKSRHLVSTQARRFAEQGYSVLVLDLFATGDSQGEFAEATWENWLQSIAAALGWLEKHEPESISFWGVRTGCLLALDFLQQNNDSVDQLICWQPVLNGELFIMQFLRLRIAALMMDSTGEKETTADLRKQLLAGESVEVAGYLLNPQLVLPLLKLNARKMDIAGIQHCTIIELVANDEATVSHACRQWYEKLQEQKGLDVVLRTLQGSPFWATQEIVQVNELIDLSTEIVCKTS